MEVVFGAYDENCTFGHWEHVFLKNGVNIFCSEAPKKTWFYSSQKG
jgi:hypothetical protein